jgi:beta-exotoxin I transport system permease protein
MPADVTWLEVRLRRRAAIGYAGGMALYTLVVVALYPSFKNSASLDSLSGSTAAALLGVTGQLTSPAGWLDGNIYGNFFPLVMLLLTIGYGAACLAGQDEDGTLALITTLPVPRPAIVLQKLAAMALRALLLAAMVAACVLAGRGFQLAVSPADVVATSVAVVLMGLDFGLIAITAGRPPADGARPSAPPPRWPPPPTCSARWPPPSPPSGQPATCRSSTGQPATTRSAGESAPPTTPS